MSDLISRQAAIEYFMTNTNWHDEDGYEIHDAEDKRKLLESYFDGIPSAQPDVPDKNVVRCKDCRYYSDVDGHEHWCNGWGWPARLITPFDYCSKGVRKNDGRPD